MDTLKDIEWGNYDFVDLGCSKGGSIKHCMDRFGAQRGLGIDLDPRKVQETRESGFDAIVADACRLELNNQVSFVTMLDFCEHLPDLESVREAISAAARIARDFLYIKHPSFEGQEQTEAQGLRQYWWNWHGHTAHVRVADYCSMFDELGLLTYMIRFIEKIETSYHPSIVPTSLPRDQSEADAKAVTDVPDIALSPPLWRRQDIFVALRPFDTRDWCAITKPTANDLKMMRREGRPFAIS